MYDDEDADVRVDGVGAHATIVVRMVVEWNVVGLRSDGDMARRRASAQ